MSTLTESLQGMMTPQLVGSLAANTGVSDTKVRNGVTAATSAIMNALVGKARDPSAMGSLAHLIAQTPDIDDPARPSG